MKDEPMTLTPEQLRELDAWLTRLFPEMEFEGVGENDPHIVCKNGQFGVGTKTFQVFNPTVNNGLALEVFKKCLKHPKCNGQLDSSWCPPEDNRSGKESFWLGHHSWDGEVETLELAICFFAQKLFSK